jgi:DNA helicase-2/ATP-dependent DNA helicase PcrA
VELSAGFAQTITPRLPKQITPAQPVGQQEVHRFVAPSAASEAELVADAIARMHAGGTPYSAIALLFRSVRTSAPLFRAALDARGIPWRCVGTSDLFLQDEAVALQKAFLLLGGRDYFDRSARERVSLTVPMVVAELGRVFGAKRSLTRWFEKTIAALPQQKAVDLVGTFYGLVEHLDVSNRDGGPRLATLARFSQLLADFERAQRRMRRVHSESGHASAEGTEFRGARSDASWAFARFASFVSFYAESSYEDGEEPLGFDVDAVTLTTVHQAKGLEWPVVFVPCLSSGRFPSRATGRPRNWLIPRELFSAERYEGTDVDERRLLYVAITRARQHLYLSTHAAVSKRAVKPSPYFVELGGAGLSVSSAPLPVPAKPCAATEAGDERPTFSFSELVSWLRCPMSYRLRLELGFQPRAAKELGYGKAVHHVLRRVAEETQRTGRVPGKEFIASIFDREFFLPYADKAALSVMRPAAERLVRRYIDHHSDDLLKTWGVERSFELQLPEAQITGRADVIVEKDGNLTILDYKTNGATGDDGANELQLAAYAAAAR